MPFAAKPPYDSQCYRMTLKLTVDNEQYSGDQRADPRNEVEDRTKTYAKKAQAHDDQKDPE
jgi:hypothetical protein